MSNEVTFTNKNAINWNNYLPDKQALTRAASITAYVITILAITGCITSLIIEVSLPSKPQYFMAKWLPADFDNKVVGPMFMGSLTFSIIMPFLIAIPEIYKWMKKRNSSDIKPLSPTESFEKAAISRQHQVCRKALFAVALVVITVSAGLLFYNYLVQSSSSFNELKRLQDISSVETVVKNMEIGGWCGLIGGGGLATVGYFSSTILEKIRLKFCQREAEASMAATEQAEKNKL